MSKNALEIKGTYRLLTDFEGRKAKLQLSIDERSTASTGRMRYSRSSPV
jgi:hypothetical protein